MTHEEIKQRAENLGLWYHEIELFPGYTTRSSMEAARPQWASVRKAMAHLDYQGKSVLDIGSMSGGWAFEAEKLGANRIVSVDVCQGMDELRWYEQCLLARVALGSRVIFLPNTDAHFLHTFTRSVQRVFRIEEGFDIVQCLGMLYHVENPMQVLRQCRQCCKTSGHLLLETAVTTVVQDKPFMRFNSDFGIYHDTTTYWAPNVPCLMAMLSICGWMPLVQTESAVATGGRDDVHRLSLVAVAVDVPCQHLDT